MTAKMMSELIAEGVTAKVKGMTGAGINSVNVKEYKEYIKKDDEKSLIAIVSEGEEEVTFKITIEKVYGSNW